MKGRESISHSHKHVFCVDVEELLIELECPTLRLFQITSLLGRCVFVGRCRNRGMMVLRRRRCLDRRSGVSRAVPAIWVVCSGILSWWRCVELRLLRRGRMRRFRRFWRCHWLRSAPRCVIERIHVFAVCVWICHKKLFECEQKRSHHRRRCEVDRSFIHRRLFCTQMTPSTTNKPMPTNARIRLEPSCRCCF